MIKVECPSCQAPYELDERRLPASGLKMRCPKCGTSFPVSASGAEVPAAPAAPPVAPAGPRRIAPPVPGSAPAAPRRIAPPVPAAPAPAATSPLDDFDLDLPAPKAAKPASAARNVPGPAAASPLDDFDLDLPAPKGAKPAAFDVDLPVPKLAKPVSAQRNAPARAAASPLDDFDLDLPAPKAATKVPAFDLDLPAPKTAAKASALPSPRAAGAATLDLDLPAPKTSPKAPALDLDLPAPKTAARVPAFDLDLPAPKTAPKVPARDLDLPAPKAGGFDRDLPAPKSGATNLDLPVRKPAGGTPFDDLDLDLPAHKPAAPGSGAFDLDLPPPRPAGGPAARSNDLGAARRPGASLGDFDLELPSPRARDAGRISLDPLADLDDGGRAIGGALGSLSEAPPPPDLGDDDLSIPRPRARGAAASGELDLGGAGDDDLEFGGIETSEGDALDALPPPNLHDIPEAVLASEKSAEQRRAEEKKNAQLARKRRFVRALAGTAVFLVVGSAAGYGLSFTKHGLFGIYALERYLPEAGTPADAQATITAAERRAKSDTYADVRASLRELAGRRTEIGLNRELLARSLVHEALYQVRFGADSDSTSRSSRLLSRLAERSLDAPGIDLALAADALREGRLGEVGRHLASARRVDPRDPYVELVTGELALAKGQHPAAAAAFRKAELLGGGARATWGLARALLASEDAGSAAALDATLAASPRHVAARTAKATRLFASGDVTSALAMAREAAGLERVGERPLRGSRRERAEALVLVGRIEERLGHRGAARAAYEQAVSLDSRAVEALVGAGRVLLEEHLVREALARFEAAIESGRHDGPSAAGLVLEATLGAVDALLALDRPQDAARLVRRLVSEHAEDARVALADGRVAQALGENERAEAAFRRGIELAPASFAGYLSLAQLFFALDRPNHAAAALALADGHVEVTAEVRRMKGESQLRRGDLAAARTEFHRALELDPHDTGSRFGLGVACRRDGLLEDAARAFDRLAALDGSYPGLALERGLVYEARGDAAEAVRAYQRALELAPSDVSLLVRLGGAQLAMGDLDAAQGTLRRALELAPNDAASTHFLGRVEFARGNVPQALAHYRQAVMVDPQRSEFHLHLAWALIEQNDFPDARTALNLVLQLDPSSGDAHWLMARIYARSGQAADALAEALRALRLAPSRVDAHAVVGDAYEQLGRRSDAIAAYQRAVDARPETAEWWYRLGRLRYDQGQMADAAAAFSRATERGDAAVPAPGWLPDAHRSLGDALRSRGDRAGAVAHYRRFLEIAGPTSIDRRDVEEALAELGTP